MHRTLGFPPQLQALSLFDTDVGIKQHAQYRAAKAGSPEAALALVTELAVSWLFEHEARFPAGAMYVAPHAKEAAGDNAIPQTLAAVAAMIFRGTVDREIVQTDRVFHTGADAMERMASRATFEGQVIPGARYVLVDDVTSLGGTLAELSNFIQCHGGQVQDALVLVNAGRNKALVPLPKQIRLIEERFQDECLQIFGIAPGALTANEAGYVVDFRSADAIRNRLFKARQEIDRRLRSKGISRSGGPAEAAQDNANTDANALNSTD